jgi:predicted lipoprotein with Yx(FWY)xxD motif
LYYYIKDVAPGETLGQGVGGVWYVVDPDKSPP